METHRIRHKAGTHPPGTEQIVQRERDPAGSGSGCDSTQHGATQEGGRGGGEEKGRRTRLRCERDEGVATAALMEAERLKERTDKKVRRQVEAQAKQGSKEAVGEAKRQRKSGRKEATGKDAHVADAEMAELEEKHSRKRRKLKHEIIDEVCGERIVP